MRAFWLYNTDTHLLPKNALKQSNIVYLSVQDRFMVGSGRFMVGSGRFML